MSTKLPLLTFMTRYGIWITAHILVFLQDQK